MTKYHYKPSPLTQALILFVLAVIPLLLLVLVSWGEHTALNITQRIISTVTILGLSSLLWGFMRWNWIAIDQETVTVRSSFYKKSFSRSIW
jgi:small-conductance mechanosensitive channel